jgi:hypothetical protein
LGLRRAAARCGIRRRRVSFRNVPGLGSGLARARPERARVGAWQTLRPRAPGGGARVAKSGIADPDPFDVESRRTVARAAAPAPGARSGPAGDARLWSGTHPRRRTPMAVTRRRALTAASAAALPLVHIRTGRAAGKLAVVFWDHWVPGANEVMQKQVKAWADKN